MAVLRLSVNPIETLYYRDEIIRDSTVWDLKFGLWPYSRVTALMKEVYGRLAGPKKTGRNNEVAVRRSSTVTNVYKDLFIINYLLYLV